MVHNRDNEVFLKVDCVEPVYDGGYSISSNSCLNGVKVWIGNDGHFFPCDRYTVCDPDVAREDGYRRAFALIKTIYDMSGNERKEAFGKVFFGEILKGANYDDLAKKLDIWKKEKDEIRVRDEVYSQVYEAKIVITKIIVPSGGEDATVNGLKKDGTAVKGLLLRNFKKTGLHVDDLDAYLEV